jgi:hypothetical protein
METVKLREESYNKLINEISYGMVDKAYDRSDDLFWDVRTSFEDFYAVLSDALFKSTEGNKDYNPYLLKIKELSEPIYDILSKKKNQQDKFFDATTNSVDHNKFYDSPEADENDIDDMDLRYLQQNYPK